MMIKRMPSALFLFFFLLINACQTISPFSQIAYEQAVSLKVDSLALMAKATEPFDRHEKEIEDVLRRVDKAFEYAKGRPSNEISARQWEILKDPKRNLLGGFVARWKEKDVLSEALIVGAQGQVEKAFDAIIGLESGKSKGTEP
ncbi:MAG: hypothetical protein V1736_05215 [Pseudomonadota bacterium]